MSTPSRPMPVQSAHPLGFLPLYRSWSNVHLRNLALTVTWSMLIGVVLTVVRAMFFEHRNLLDYLGPMLVVSNTVGFVIHGGLAGMSLLLRGWPKRQRGTLLTIYYLTMISILSVVGIVLGNAILLGANPWHYLKNASNLAPLMPFGFGMAVLMFVIGAAAQSRTLAELQILRQREEIAAAAQLLAEARLRALQAQIEPHFLYNTLANVLSLIDTQPAQARHMLERFIDFLRASLQASRADSATVGAELDLAAAYLDVLTVRMGKRLQYRIEADPSVRTAVIAPMLIQPLVENAVMHGLEPKVEGGTIVVRAHCDGAALQIDIIDDGVGIGNAPARAGGGVGMANVKSRALSMHGADAQLQLLDNPGGGAIVRLLLPASIKVTSSTSPQP